MNYFLLIAEKFDNIVAKIEEVALVIFVAAMAVIIFMQVIFRYVLKNPIFWSEELTRYIFVWVVLLGASINIKKKGHYGIDILYKTLPDKVRMYVGILISLMMGVVIFTLLTQSIILVKSTFIQISPAMEISMGWAYGSLTVGGTFMAIHFLIAAIRQANEALKKS
jgi:TRAP-type C4-dicarboxylate transport system permease small subunit